MSRINPAPRNGVCAPPACVPGHCGASWVGGGAPSWENPHAGQQAHATKHPQIILWSLIAAFVLFCGGYYLGKDLALRDNARQSVGR
ncbi:hypothetical protein JAK51_18540 [Stenotrophomonas maltophilia]|uniref:hypothetical protein n=1 Tax=Stenotrophomonas maltophilia TaxID=40324 RepID=UPI0021C8A9CD|nr:hypothetical protein [Stenotrophomonas maltophilia]MCU1128203.1 hypothetical protein [Stenotrophomonas maltophilia]